MSDHSQRPQSDNDNSKVYISNINKSVLSLLVKIEQEDIRRKFSEFGVIKSLILKKKENNVTYSFIQYEKPSEANAAIASMDKKIYFDRVLKVEHGKGGHRGLEHYHTNRYDRPRFNQSFYRDQPDRSFTKPDQYHRKRSYSYSSDSYDRYKQREGSRSPYDRYRSGYKPYPDKYRDHRQRSRSFQRPRYDRREYRDDRYKDDERYRKPYREYPEPRYRDEMYNMYRRDRTPQRRDYEKDRRKEYRDTKDKQLKDDRFYKEADRYTKDERFVGDRYDKYPRPEYKDFRRDGYQRRKEFNGGRQQVVNERNDNKDYLNYQPRQGYDRRRSGSRDNKPRLDQFPRIGE